MQANIWNFGWNLDAILLFFTFLHRPTTERLTYKVGSVKRVKNATYKGVLMRLILSIFLTFGCLPWKVCCCCCRCAALIQWCEWRRLCKSVYYASYPFYNFPHVVHIIFTYANDDVCIVDLNRQKPSFGFQVYV